jgi:hypothetical protein
MLLKYNHKKEFEMALTTHTRRDFIKFSTFTGVWISCLSTPLLLMENLQAKTTGLSSRGHITLTPEMWPALRALTPVILGKSKTQIDPVFLQSLMDHLDSVLTQMGKRNKDLVVMLLKNLNNLTMKRLLTGLWQPWEDTPEEDIAEFLEKWLASSANWKQEAAKALTQIIQLARYTSKQSWSDVSYPGPPQYYHQENL